MRTRSSSTAQESGFEIPPPAPHSGVQRTIAEALVPGHQTLTRRESTPRVVSMQPIGRGDPSPGDTWQQEGLLHDVRNLVSSVSLYCDLLSVPHVLRPEHRHYAKELRLLGERSAALIERLLGATARSARGSRVASSSGATEVRSALESCRDLPAEENPRFEGLRSMVERCAGLLHCVAGGQSLEVVYGDASALTVRVPAESVERILVNLVRNAAAASGRRRGSIRVGVGLPPGDAEAIRPWPFQRIMLTVEDSGCGMAGAEVEQLLIRSDPAQPHSPSSHGIGFRVVRELVEASRGELSVQSRPGEGTRVQIEWPVVQPQAQVSIAGRAEVKSAGETRRSA